MKPMNDYKTDDELISAVLNEMTPLERATHNAMTAAYMIGSYAVIAELVQQIKEVEELRDTMDLEERALLPLAESALYELICELPTYGDA